LVFGNTADNTIKLAGWTATTTQLSSTNLVIHSEGRIETGDFASGIKGWRIDESGEAEFENATIRGTLATVTFEKQSINAVGGQLWIANSSAISGSTVGIAETTMSVVNASGFTADEYLITKKISPTGFSQEIMKVVSASIDNGDTGGGRIMVTRGTSGSAAEYDEGQVLVSTGRLNTGYIKLNANPSDASTPYIDIIERTGSDYPDFDLKARLGDLSGLSSALVGTNPGYGLYSQNVFLTGTITATAGYLGGWVVGDTFISSSDNNALLDSSSPIFAIGANAQLMDMTTGTGVFMSGSGDFRFGDADGYMKFENGSFEIRGADVDINVENLDIAATDFQLSSTQASMSLGTQPITWNSGLGIHLSGSGQALIGDADGYRLAFDGTNVIMSSSVFYLGDSTNYISGSEGNITIFNTGATTISGSEVNIQTPKFYLGGTSQYISGSDGNLEISSSNFYLDNTGNLTLTGNVTANSGNIGGFTITNDALSSNNFFLSGSATGNEYFLSSSNFNIKASGDITGSAVKFTGGDIAGWNFTTGSFSKNGIRLDSSGEAGLYIKDSFSQDIITVASKSMFALGSAIDEIGNDSFEEDPLSIWQTDGYHVGTSAIPLTVPSWSMSMNGPISHSVTKRTGSPTFGQFNKALIGDFSYDVVYPGMNAPEAALSRSLTDTSASYLTTNNYELSQIISASSDAGLQWNAGNVISMAFVAKSSHSLSGVGYDRGLDQQKYRVDYWDTDTSEWVGFIPARSGSQPFANYSLGNRWSSIKAAGALPKSTHKLKIILSGSVNAPTFKTSISPLYSEWFVDKVSQLLAGVASFTGDTLIRMSDKTQKPIKDIAVGDEILAYNKNTKAFSTSTVKYKKKRYANSFYNINSEVYATAEHPFYVSGSSGLVTANDLKIGDKLLMYDETYKTIETVTQEDFGAHIYNMSLKGVHTYFAADFLTHNFQSEETDAPPAVEEVIETTIVTSPKYPYTELSFDNFRVVQDQPRIEMSAEGFLLYQSEVSYLKMTPNAFFMRTPSDSGAGIGNAVTSQMDTTNTGVFGQLAAPVLQGYDAEPTDIGTSAFAGGSSDYARGDHRHNLPFSVLNTVIGTSTIDNLDVNNLTMGGGTAFSITGSLAVSSSVDSYFVGGGGVGIGTDTADVPVHIYRNATIGGLEAPVGTNGGFHVQDSGADMYMDGNSILLSSNGWISNTGNFFFAIGTNNSYRLFVTGTGDVGIGTTIPATTGLHVWNNVSASTYYGDGTNLSGVVSNPMNEDFIVTGSIYVSGSYYGDGSTLTGVATIVGNDKQIFFNKSGTTISGSDGFVYDYSNTRIGIGTTTPAKTLSINTGTNDDGIILSDAGNQVFGQLLYNSANDGGYLQLYDTGVSTILLRGYGESYFLNSVGIGTNNPTQHLDIYNATAPTLQLTNASTN
jgi:hypothetical protein